MAVRITIKVRGVNDFLDNHQAFLQKTTAQANRGLDSIADIAKDEMVASCPVGTPESTGIPGYVGGTLRDSHEIMPDQEGQYRLIRYLYNDVYYAQWVHDGTYKMAARPWMLNGFYATRGRMLPEMVKA